MPVYNFRGNQYDIPDDLPDNKVLEFFKQKDTEQKPDDSKLLNFIAKGESWGYDTMNKGTKNKKIVGATKDSTQYLGKKLTEMTVQEVMDAQKNKELSAAGRYQFIPKTLDYVVKQSGIDLNSKFDQDTQDNLARTMLYKSHRKNLAKYLSGQSDDLNAAMLDMAKEWASVPDPVTGMSYYGGGANKAHHSIEDVKAALEGARTKTMSMSDVKRYEETPEGERKVLIDSKVMDQIETPQPDLEPTPAFEPSNISEKLIGGFTKLEDGMYSDTDGEIYEIKQGRIFMPGSDQVNTSGDKGMFLKQAGEYWEQLPDTEKAAIVTSPVPFIGTAVGAYADKVFYEDPENRTWGNMALTAVGYIPFGVGSVARVMRGAGRVAKDVTGQVENLVSPFNGRTFTFHRTVEPGTIKMAEKGPRELGSHATTDPRVAKQFEIPPMGGKVRSQTYKTTTTLKKGLVINKDLNVFHANTIIDYLRKNPQYADDVTQEMVELSKRQTNKMRNIDKIAEKSLEDRFGKNWRATYSKELADVIHTGEADNLANMYNESYGKALQYELKKKGYDHIAYKNTGETVENMEGNFVKREIQEEAVKDKLGTNEFDVSVVLFDPQDWK